MRGTVGRRTFAEKVKAGVAGEAMTKCSRPAHRGTEGGTMEKTRYLNWGTSRVQPIRDRRAKTRWTKKISQREDARVSDEAILSDELEGQHNLPGSQEPLDRVVRARGTRQIAVRLRTPLIQQENQAPEFNSSTQMLAFGRPQRCVLRGH